MRQKTDKEISEKYTSQVNIANQTDIKSLQHKKIIFKDAVVLPYHTLFIILTHCIDPDSVSNGSDSTG